MLIKADSEQCFAHSLNPPSSAALYASVAICISCCVNTCSPNVRLISNRVFTCAADWRCSSPCLSPDRWWVRPETAEKERWWAPSRCCTSSSPLRTRHAETPSLSAHTHRWIHKKHLCSANSKGENWNMFWAHFKGYKCQIQSFLVATVRKDESRGGLVVCNLQPHP